MKCCSNSLEGVFHIANTSPISMIEINLLSRFDHGLLSIGGWGDVTYNAINIDGINMSQLVPVGATQRIFQAPRQKWVYENYIEYVNADGDTISPIEPIIYQDGVVMTSGYTINYDLGQVVLDSPTNEDMRAEYSYKLFNLSLIDRELWFKQVNFWDDLSSFFDEIPDCDSVYLVNSVHRVQLPLLLIGASNRGRASRYCIGNCYKKFEYDIHFYILSECKEDRNKLVNIVLNQSDVGFCTFNADAAACSGELPINCGGLSSETTFLELINKYPWKSILTKQVQIVDLEMSKNGLFKAMLKMPVEITLCNSAGV